jgi:hypothetical protein
VQGDSEFLSSQNPPLWSLSYAIWFHTTYLSIRPISSTSSTQGLGFPVFTSLRTVIVKSCMYLTLRKFVLYFQRASHSWFCENIHFWLPKSVCSVPKVQIFSSFPGFKHPQSVPFFPLMWETKFYTHTKHNFSVTVFEVFRQETKIQDISRLGVRCRK